MKANTYRGREEDIAAMLDSLHEIFQEKGDQFTAALVTERMEQNYIGIFIGILPPTLPLNGVDSRKGNWNTDQNKYYVIPDPKLLAEKRV